jgi:hypothetical protein
MIVLHLPDFPPPAVTQAAILEAEERLVDAVAAAHYDPIDIEHADDVAPEAMSTLRCYSSNAHAAPRLRHSRFFFLKWNRLRIEVTNSNCFFLFFVIV